ncbi:MAG: metal-dependent hydrolase [Chloroflexota bacterium]|nr:metal-dependent hydrolase [Chloroflexota bacterium]
MAVRVPSGLIVTAVATWIVAEAAQWRVGVSMLWALLDEVSHGAVAATCVLWLAPRWGLRPTLVAVLAATLIDVDHVIAAGSFTPERMMHLPARPPTHSLAGVLGLAIAAGTLGGPRVGYAVAVGVLTHILRDATAAPGVPLLVPAVADKHVIVPFWAFAASVVGLSAVHAAIAPVRLTRGVRRRWWAPRPSSAGR